MLESLIDHILCEVLIYCNPPELLSLGKCSKKLHKLTERIFAIKVKNHPLYSELEAIKEIKKDWIQLGMILYYTQLEEPNLNGRRYESKFSGKYRDYSTFKFASNFTFKYKRIDRNDNGETHVVYKGFYMMTTSKSMELWSFLTITQVYRPRGYRWPPSETPEYHKKKKATRIVHPNEEVRKFKGFIQNQSIKVDHVELFLEDKNFWP